MHSHQIKQYLGVIFVAVFVIFGIFFYFIADENIHIFLYVFLFYIIFSVFLGRKFSFSKHSHVHALVLICSYFILQCVYTASPRIQFEEFKLCIRLGKKYNTFVSLITLLNSIESGAVPVLLI
ncbi:hypothetical protein [Acinetobacter bereziniae]|uniref:hypothetical protein n=1 Tax=Acinetobacter bereziniae TaxID=106648 RepID=UPI001D186FE2|nr:hypothetical protein [Acinetobacter bereziniae]